MDRRHPLFPTAAILLLVLAAIVVPPPPASSQELTFYDHLRRYGLPIGLFPKGITTYSLDPSDGSFLLNLPQPCNAKFENEVHYDFNVSGVLLFSQIANLSGVSAQELFLWFPVKHIRVDVPASGLIHFDVGVVDKQFSLSLFERPPDCAASALDPFSLPDPEVVLPLPPPLSVPLSLNVVCAQASRLRMDGAIVDDFWFLRDPKCPLG